MRRWLVVVVLATLAAVLVVILTRDRSRGDQTGGPAGAVPARAGPAAPRGGAGVRTAPAPPPDATLPGADEAARIQQGLEDAHAHLQDLVAPCFSSAAAAELPASTTIRVRYRLVAAGGTAHAMEAELIEASAALGEVAACSIERIGRGTWPTPLPDLETPVEDELVVRELR